MQKRREAWEGGEGGGGYCFPMQCLYRTEQMREHIIYLSTKAVWKREFRLKQWLHSDITISYEQF
jgi:hypothetical protein